MKQIIAGLLICLLVISLAGCAEAPVTPAPSSGITAFQDDPAAAFTGPIHCSGPMDENFTLTEAEQTVLLEILNRGSFHDGLPECVPNFTLTVSSRRVDYAMHSGIFMDMTHCRTRYLSEEDKAAVNRILFPTVTMWQYSWSSAGISTKTIEGGSFVRGLVKELEALEPTGDTAPALSDGDFDIHGDCPAQPGTLWLGYGDKLYRLPPGMAEAIRVDRHYGEGETMPVLHDLRTKIRDAWQYHPRDFYTGVWQNGHASLKSVYKAPSEVTIRVIKIDEWQAPNYHITLEVTACRDRNVELWLHSYFSEDHLGSSDYRELSMQANVPQTVELYYAIFPEDVHWLSITADNTAIELEVIPGVCGT